MTAYKMGMIRPSRASISRVWINPGRAYGFGLTCVIAAAFVVVMSERGVSAQEPLFLPSTVPGLQEFADDKAAQNSELQSHGSSRAHSDFTFEIETQIDVKDPRVKSAVVLCELFRSGSVLPIAVGRAVIPVKPSSASTSTQLSIAAVPRPGNDLTYESAIGDIIAGRIAAKDVKGSWGCSLQLSDHVDGANARSPNTAEADLRSTNDQNVLAVSGTWQDMAGP